MEHKDQRTAHILKRILIFMTSPGPVNREAVVVVAIAVLFLLLFMTNFMDTYRTQTIHQTVMMAI